MICIWMFWLVAIILVSEMTSVTCETSVPCFNVKTSHCFPLKNGPVFFQQEVYQKSYWNIRKDQKRKFGVMEKGKNSIK